MSTALIFYGRKSPFSTYQLSDLKLASIIVKYRNREATYSVTPKKLFFQPFFQPWPSRGRKKYSFCCLSKVKIQNQIQNLSTHREAKKAKLLILVHLRSCNFELQGVGRS